MDRPRFRTIRKKLAPWWLTTGEGGLVGYSLDLVKDAFVERLRLGLMARFPQNDPSGATTAPDDALAATGRDRRLIRGINETSQAYAARLLTWLDDRHAAGTAFMLMKQLAAYCGAGFSFRTVDARGNWFSRDVNGVETRSLATGNWNWDAAPATRWSRFWVIIYPSAIWQPTPYDYGQTGAPKFGVDKQQFGVAIPREQIASVRAIVRDWKPAHARCENIIVAFDPASFNPSSPEPNGLWGNWSKVVGGVRVPSRLSTARYLAGVV